MFFPTHSYSFPSNAECPLHLCGPSSLSFQQKHPHIIFEARTKANKGCANSGSMEWRQSSRRPKREAQMDAMSSVLEGIWGSAGAQAADRFRRDVRETTKYIETAIVIDKAMFEKRNGSTRAEVIHDAIQVANIADLVRTQ